MLENRKNALVMIADDDELIRKMLIAGLTGFSEFIETDKGENVVELYREKKPNMVILDIHLPNYSGIKLLNEILSLDPEAYIIIVSADSTQVNVQECIDKGAKGFLAKPISKDHLQMYFNKCPTIPIAIK